ncbi:MAG: DinB family protein [Thermoguttaceae bacterium]
MDHKKMIADYLAGPAVLRKAVAGMTREQLLARPIPGKWSTLEVVCHLADFEIIITDRIKRIIAEEEPTMFNGDPDLFAGRLAYHQRDFEEELLLIDVIRKQISKILGTLTEADFQRSGNHSEYGRVTLETILGKVTTHIQRHVEFVEEKRKALSQAA